MATWTRTVKDPSPKDVVIAIIGPTGCGKSTFINWLKSSHYDDPSQPCAEACSGLKPNTKELRPYHFKLGVDRAPRRLVILDTPGLDGDPEIGKDAILDEISKWLHNTYPGYGMRLAGIVYLYPVTQARLTRFHSVCVKKLMKLCRSPSFSRIVVGTTQWTDVDLEAGAQVENALKGSQFSAAYMTRIETEKDCTKAIEYVLDAFRVEEGIISAAKRIILVLGLTGAGKSSVRSACKCPRAKIANNVPTSSSKTTSACPQM
ncbi:hypothetical protein FA15DRAFT_665420 [Coprinopsis marcescibilis]|uniref:G domain-containing protein n=1 Tax=Coprinopsis marcescibilis TaxID=230819 RepID=A0A5C3L6R4_COPMA|nr:hypothetical protein FA15DRAFT_665420 [Coprinopsis marcescibilis]